MLAVFKSVYFTRIHTGSLRVYTRWLPPRSPPSPGAGAPARAGRLGLWGELVLVSRDASRVHSSSVHSLHALPAASVPAIHKMLYSRCLKRFCSS